MGGVGPVLCEVLMAGGLVPVFWWMELGLVFLGWLCHVHWCVLGCPWVQYDFGQPV